MTVGGKKRGRDAIRTALAVSTAVGLTACTGSLFQSKALPPSVYLLSLPAGVPLAQGASAPPLAADLAVLRPRIRKGLDTDRIAVLYPDRRLDFVADARWSGPLDEVLQDLAVQALRSGSGLRNVSADASAFSSGYWLELDVADFQAEVGSGSPTIRVRLLARLGRATDRRIVGAWESTSIQNTSGNHLTSMVDAFERAVGTALAEIMTDTTHVIDADLKQRAEGGSVQVQKDKGTPVASVSR